MTNQTDISDIKSALLAGLPLTGEQIKLRDELLPLAGKVASNLLARWKRHSWLSAEDLRQQAALELESAVREYDPARSPDAAAFIGCRIRQRLQTWLQAQRREHSRYRPLVHRRGGSCGRKLSYRDNALDKLIAEELAASVRRAFSGRDISVYTDKLTGRPAEVIAQKHNLSPQRVNQICAEVRAYIHGKLKDDSIPIKHVINALINYEIETRKRAMKLLGYSEREILEKIGNPFSEIDPRLTIRVGGQKPCHITTLPKSQYSPV